jgi:hypothetical protein
VLEVTNDPFLQRDLRPTRISGFPIAATNTPNSTELRRRHFDITINQRKVFRDHIVDATTGLPVNSTSIRCIGFAPNICMCQMKGGNELRMNFDSKNAILNVWFGVGEANRSRESADSCGARKSAR